MPEKQKLFEHADIERDLKGKYYVLADMYPISPGFLTKKEAEGWLARANGDFDA
jgi:hypothetical protein